MPSSNAPGPLAVLLGGLWLAGVPRRLASTRTADQQLPTCYKFDMRLKLGDQTWGRMPVTLAADQSLRQARGQITEQAKAALGRDVQLHRFIITLRGRTGYLRPELEEEPIRVLAPLTSTNATVELVDAEKPASPRQRIQVTRPVLRAKTIISGLFSQGSPDTALVAAVGDELFAQIRNLVEKGDRDEVKVPMRVLRDEISRVYFSSPQHTRNADVEALFQLYDQMEAMSQSGLRDPEASATDRTVYSVLLAELRARITRMVVGETWEDFPELKLWGLKRMFKYARQERAAEKSGSRKLETAGSGLKLRTLSRKWSGMSAGGEGTWVMAFEDLQRAPASKLFPLVRVLLQADSLTETGDAATLSALAPGKESRLEPRGSDASALGCQMSGMQVNDLLGLGSEPGSARSPTTDDPFQAREADVTSRVGASNGAAATPEQQHYQTVGSPPVRPGGFVAGSPHHARQGSGLGLGSARGSLDSVHEEGRYHAGFVGGAPPAEGHANGNVGARAGNPFKTGSGSLLPPTVQVPTLGHTSPQHSPTPASFAVTPMLTSSNPSPDGTPVGGAAQGLSFGGGSHGFDPFQLSSQPAASPFGTDAAQEQRQQTRSPRAAGLYDNRFADLTPLSPQSAHQRPPVTSSTLPMRTSSSNRSGAW
eukprot:jgi/Astpho2/3438/fgenesh1_pg.00055_%23_7_t